MKQGCAIAFVGFVSLAAALAIYLAATGAKPAANDRVTVRATGGNNIVQMFDSIGANASVIEQFPSGTNCTRISGPTPVTIEGVSMRFYKLTCDGTMGYVNAQWVR